MENSDPADQGAQRNGAERVVQIAAKWNKYLDTLNEPMSQLIRDGLSSLGRADINGKAVIMLICAAIKIVRHKLVFEMGRQDRGPRFRIGTTLIAVGLGCVSCSLLMNVMFGDMPWPTFVACVLILVTPFVFIANQRVNYKGDSVQLS